jgi:hypothetical protein
MHKVDIQGSQRGWTTVETWALLVGINKHGTNCWRAILEDPDSKALSTRTTAQLKDKARNLHKRRSGWSVLFRRAEKRILFSAEGLLIPIDSKGAAPLCGLAKENVDAVTLPTAADFAWADSVVA